MLYEFSLIVPWTVYLFVLRQCLWSFIISVSQQHLTSTLLKTQGYLRANIFVHLIEYRINIKWK